MHWSDSHGRVIPLSVLVLVLDTALWYRCESPERQAQLFAWLSSLDTGALGIMCRIRR
jgi:hypothetical protein